MRPQTLAGQFRSQGDGCLPGSPLYSALLHAAADDIDAGGVTAEVLAGREGDPAGSVLALRLMGAVHRLVLQRQAPELAMYYPSVGGHGAVDQAWPAFRRLLEAQAPAVRGLLDRPVQTNDVGRSAALFGGLLVVADRTGLPIRLLEAGASAGLNLRVDHFGYDIGGETVLGDAGSEVRLPAAWVGTPPAPLDVGLRVVARRGCDPAPVDPATTEGRLTLASYVWADWQERVDRLRAALVVAARVPAVVDRAHSDEWLTGQLATPQPGVVTVIWHSMVWQYVDHAERRRARAAVLDAAGRATRDAPLAHLSLEPRARGGESWRCELWLTMWPGPAGVVRLGHSPGHGVPITWG